MVASIKGTLSKDIVRVLDKISLDLRNKVKEVTLDMANNMETSARQCFANAKLVTDRFHVVRLAIEAIQHIRIKLRWDELDKENTEIANAKKRREKYKPEILSNGDTQKQLLARSKYILMKKPYQWTKSQKERADLLFSRYPILWIAYNNVLDFRKIYELKDRNMATVKFRHWCENIGKSNIVEFNTVANTVKNNFENILNFFTNRHTNANAESFNAKIKLFRANLRGVTDSAFFLFRIAKLFA